MKIDEDFVSKFEQHIIYCCRAPEYDLRKWLKKALPRAGFRLIEDDYKTDRIKNDNRYENVHNLVAIRGENPSVCLVSHTDVCREHDTKRRSSVDSHEEFIKWLSKPSDKDDFNKVKDGVLKNTKTYRVDPIIKVIENNGNIRRIIQDRLCKLQVGGDDRLGVAINTWIALNTSHDMGLYFPTDEEIGLKSAYECKIEDLKNFDLLVQIDRGNKSNELVVKIGEETLCSYEVATKLLEMAYDIGLPRGLVTGMHTDVYALKSRGWIKNCVNMTCGYHNSYGAGSEEYICIKEALNTLKYALEIVKKY